MSGLIVDTQRCVGCRRCVRACSSAGIEVIDRKAHVTASCIACGMCVGACPVDALRIEKDAEAAVPSASDVWVFAEQRYGEALPVVYELLGRARQLADTLGCRLVAVLGCGSRRDDVVESLFQAGADEVIRCRDVRLSLPDAHTYAEWFARLARLRNPAVVLFGATGFGRELAPGVAARLRTGLTADCTVLEIDPETGLLQQTRPAFGGNLMATIVCPAHRPQMATVRAGVFPPAQLNPSRSGTLTEVELDPMVMPLVRLLEELPGEMRTLTDAQTLVVVGRGIGSAKNLPLMERLADLLGGKMGCSRPLVESGWCEYWRQVGQTGVSVAPKLLVSVGVSGAIQHLAGIGGAETVIAINTDASAPIFGSARYAAVGDCVQVVKELVAVLESRVS